VRESTMIETTRREYNAGQDYLRIRQFLIATFALYGGPTNWLLDRWNFCRYFAVPVHTFYNMSYFSVPTLTHKPFRDEVAAWEKTIWVWENSVGEIVGVFNSANEEAGEAFCQVHPDYTHLYGEMVDHAEEHLADRVDGVGYVKLYVYEGTALEQVAQAKGYTRINRRGVHREYKITGEEETPVLPEGFVIRTVAEKDNLEERRKAKGISFGAHYAPSDWPPAWVYREMEKAPDYRPELDLYIEAPNGDCASFCTIWVDEENRYANFEPVGSRVEYQGMGLARALLMEGFQLMAQHGVTRSFMDSNNEFYSKVGFEDTGRSYYPWFKHFEI